MVPRKKLDIGWADLAFALAACVFAGERDTVQQRLERWWSPAGPALAFLSVRSGFDLLLQHLALPRGSEILVSAITIRNMVDIIEHHGLNAVPVDVDRRTCEVLPQTLERAITPNCKAILVAHLFGSRMAMDGIVDVARRHRLFLFEDCAQAFAADGYRGHAGSDAVMFSFGTIKTATALGGALFNFRDAALRDAIAARTQSLPVQPRAAFLRRVMKIALLHALSCRLPYSIFVSMCRALGTDHDLLIGGAVRGFPGDELIRKLRHQTPAAMLALLERRLRAYTAAALAPRMQSASRLLQLLPAPYHLAAAACSHSHWVLPILSNDPDALVAHLWRQGFDATRGASSMIAVNRDRGNAVEARHIIDHIVYLPFETCDTDGELQKLAQVVVQFEHAA